MSRSQLRSSPESAPFDVRAWRGDVKQEEIADVLGMSRKHWGRIERGEWPVPIPLLVLMLSTKSAKALARKVKRLVPMAG